jgi:hypothetical protein
VYDRTFVFSTGRRPLMTTAYIASDKKIAPRTRWWKRLGLAGFAFFLIKGLLWLMAPAVLYLLR